MLGAEFYANLVNSAYALRGAEELDHKKLPKGRIVPYVEDHLRPLLHIQDFNHFAPAAWLMEHSADGKKLPGFELALKQVQELIDAINASLPPE